MSGWVVAQLNVAFMGLGHGEDKTELL